MTNSIRRFVLACFSFCEGLFVQTLSQYQLKPGSDCTALGQRTRALYHSHKRCLNALIA